MDSDWRIAKNSKTLNNNIRYSQNFNEKINAAILKPVWKWLTKAEKAILRQLSKSLKEDIDISIGCEIYLDDEQFPKKQTLAPSACIVNVISLSSIYNVQMIISYPLMITKINLKGKVNSENLIRLLRVSYNLEQLSLSPDFAVSGISKSISNSSIVTLYKFRELNIINECKNISQPFWKNVEYILRILDTPNLENLLIQNFFNCPKEFESSINGLIKYISKWSSLRHLNLNLHKGEECEYDENNHDFQILHEPKVVEEFDLQLDKLETCIIHCDKPFHQIADHLLKKCKKLVNFSYSKPWASWVFYSSIILANTKTLRCIKIANAAPRIDLSCIKLCENLEVLNLSKEQQSGNDKLTPNIISFDTLPKSLKQLQIRNYTVDSLDLMSIHRLTNLRSVELEFLSTRYNPECGIMASVVLMMMTRFRKLNEIFIEEDITHNTSLHLINSFLQEINMVPFSNIIKRLGIERWALAVVSDDAIENWRSKLHIYAAQKCVNELNDLEV